LVAREFAPNVVDDDASVGPGHPEIREDLP
jgi:hypothetical protein